MSDVAELCAQLIRFDTSNYGDDVGDGGSGPGERECAQWIAAYLADLGCDVQVFESNPRRTTIVTRIAGADPDRPALVVHGHTDVVPAQAADWQVDPFAGEIREGLVWGRGAVDMKGMDAMILTVLADYLKAGRRPARDLIVAFFADEESGGELGSHWMVDHHPEVFAGATEAISEVGGFSVQVGGQRAYLLQTAEKHLAWLRLTANGRAGHGSAVNRENAITRLAAAVARIGAHQWPITLTPTVSELLKGIAELTGLPFDAGASDAEQVSALLAQLGPAAKFVGATAAHTANPTMLNAGYKANVIPGQAEAVVDARFLPGNEAAAMDKLRELAGPGVEISPVHEDIALQQPFAGPLVDAMVAALDAEDPGAVVLPYLLGAGTDNKALSRLGIRGYGFSPLKLPADLDFTGLFHGVDERVPVEALEFGVRVLDRFFATC